MQVDIFSIMYPSYKITKPIRLIELFGGYGSQHLALKYLGIEVEHWKLVEWAVKSIQAYKDLHYTDINIDYSKDLTKEEITEYLFNLGISSNYNEPMTYEQIKRLKEEQLRNIYNNIKITKNLVNIQNVKGKDLEIIDTDKYDYIMTYSFPCQDLSLAGLGKGMDKDSGTRSGMLWEVERILDECEELPQVLLMENVPEVKGTNNVKYFNEWQSKLESLGYKNYHQNLIATDYGIPQTRNRTFMISILGDYSYTFPEKIPLKLKLKDMLEENVDEKYYLSSKQIEQISNWNAYEKPLEHLEDEICGTLTTRSGAFAAGMKLTYDTLKIPEATKKGYAEATNGDGVYINRPHQKRGVVQQGLNQTLKTSGQDIGVVVKNINKKAKHQQDFINDSNGNSRTLVCGTHGNGGHYTKTITNDNGNLRIRKLTPRECFRLMGVKDEDYKKIAKNQNDSSLYHLAGDSIVVNVLEAIFKELL